MRFTGDVTATFTMTAFDVVAAACFGVPTLGLMSLRLFSEGAPHYSLLGLAALSFAPLLVKLYTKRKG